MNNGRFVILHGKFGCYFYDSETGIDLTLMAVLEKLNESARVREQYNRLTDRLSDKYLEMVSKEESK